MNFFLWLWNSWRIKDWAGQERLALLRVLHELYVCDYEFAPIEKQQYQGMLDVAREHDCAELSLNDAIGILLKTHRTEQVLYEFLAVAVVCDLKYTPEEKAFLRALEAAGFNRQVLEEWVEREKHRRGQLQEVEHSKLGELIARYAEILHRFSGSVMPWKRLAATVTSWFAGTDFGDVQLPLGGAVEADAALLNGLFQRAGLAFHWHGQFAGHLVYEIALADGAKFDRTFAPPLAGGTAAAKILLPPYLNPQQRQRVRQAEREYGLEWLEFPMLSSNQSTLDAESDFRLFGQDFGKCYKANIGHVFAVYQQRGELGKVVDLFRTTACAFADELNEELPHLVATANWDGQFFIAHAMFWRHLNEFLAALIGLNGIPLEAGILLDKNLQEVFLDYMEALHYVIFLAPVIVGDRGIHNIILGPVVSREEQAETFLGQEIRFTLVRYDASRSGVKSLVEQSCFDRHRRLIFLDVSQTGNPEVELSGMVLRAENPDVWAARAAAAVLFHEKVHCLFDQGARPGAAKVAVVDGREFPAEIAFCICSEIWARLLTLHAFPDAGLAEVDQLQTMLRHGAVYNQTAQWILRRLGLREELFVGQTGFSQTAFERYLRDQCRVLLEESLAEMAAQRWRVAALRRAVDHAAGQPTTPITSEAKIQWTSSR